MIFFAGILSILLIKLFSLQVVQGTYWSEVLLNQHYTTSDMNAKRGQIYTTDSSWKRLQLTENVAYFTLYADPHFVKDIPRVKEVLVPLIYRHFCEVYGLEYPSKRTCIEHIEEFTWEQIFPERQETYVATWGQQYFIDDEEYEQNILPILSGFNQEQAFDRIGKKLDSVLQWGIKQRNYLGFYDNDQLLQTLSGWSFDYIDIVDKHYVYIVPDRIEWRNIDSSVQALQKALQKYGYYRETSKIKALFVSQPIRYVKIMTNMNAKIAKEFRDAKRATYEEKTDRIPLLHGFGLEEYERRYYPHEWFMANILWYVDQQWDAYYGIEEYFDETLAGTDGNIIWLATPWIGQVWANNFEISQAQHGSDVYLTIDPVIQKELETLARSYHEWLAADSLAITVLDPATWKVKALINTPSFNPNTPQDSYKLKPLSINDRNLIERMDYVDIPVFLLSGSSLTQATSDERLASSAKKYIFENRLWPQVFVDKNIAFPYEPWSIFKSLTLGIAMDSDTLDMFDYYHDAGKVTIGPFTIANISWECTGDHTYLHALEYSCNVWMVRMAQKMTKYVFYSYLEKLGFGKLTGIELAGEEGWFLENYNTVSQARFFNNTYGQWLLATPLQMAVSYAALVNWWALIKPTIIEALYDHEQESYIDLGERYDSQVFKDSTSEYMKDALVSIIDNGNLRDIRKTGYSLWGKTGTSEIAFRGNYQSWRWWTNWSFVWMVTKDATNYVVAVQVRRPRSSQWWLDTAGRVFSSVADFLIAYDAIES